MSVGAISNIGIGISYLPVDTEYEEIKQKLIAMGLTPTGVKSTDKTMLEEALKKQEDEEIEKLEENKDISNTSSLSESSQYYLKLFIEIADDLHVQRKNDLEEDAKLVLETIAEKLSDQNETSLMKATYMSMVNDLRLIFPALDLNISFEPVEKAMVGATAISDYNRYALGLAS